MCENNNNKKLKLSVMVGIGHPEKWNNIGLYFALDKIFFNAILNPCWNYKRIEPYYACLDRIWNYFLK